MFRPPNEGRDTGQLACLPGKYVNKSLWIHLYANSILIFVLSFDILMDTDWRQARPPASGNHWNGREGASEAAAVPLGMDALLVWMQG